MLLPIDFEDRTLYNINIDIDIIMEVDMPNINDLLSQAIGESSNLNKGETFIVRDLFKGYEWNRISRGDRLLLGTLFLNYVNTEHISITPLEKTTSGQQKYQRL